MRTITVRANFSFIAGRSDFVTLAAKGHLPVRPSSIEAEPPRVLAKDCPLKVDCSLAASEPTRQN